VGRWGGEKIRSAEVEKLRSGEVGKMELERVRR
jgi:hypothetical protein